MHRQAAHAKCGSVYRVTTSRSAPSAALQAGGCWPPPRGDNNTLSEGIQSISSEARPCWPTGKAGVCNLGH